MKLLENRSLKPFHTFCVEVQAKEIIEAHSKEDFLEIWQQKSAEPKLILGEGSNVLFCEDYAGTVVLNRLKGIEKSETDSDFLLHVQGGENWHNFVIWCLDHGMLGMENLALIPGVVGSAPIQNIGAYGAELQQFCDYVDVLLLETEQFVRLSKQECHFGYRDSIFKNQLKDKAVVIAVGFKISKNWQPNIAYGPLSSLKETLNFDDQKKAAKAIFDRVCEVRQEKLPDPSKIGNAGSFFKNPVVAKSLADALKLQYPNMPCYLVDEKHTKLAAGWLIEQSGMKGVSHGGAGVHDKQALVLVNRNHAKAKEVVELARIVIEKVQTKFGVTLHPEVRLWGKTQEISW